MVDINALVAQYLKNNSEADLSKIGGALENLSSAIQDNRSLNSIFTVDSSYDGLTRDEFINLMCTATGESRSSIEDDANVLFNILDNEESGKDNISRSELAIFMDGDEVSNFRIWDKLLGWDVDEINEYKATLDSEDIEEDSTPTGTTSTDETTTTDGSTATADGTTSDSAASGTDGSAGTNKKPITQREAEVEAQKLFTAIDKLGTDEDIVFGVLRDSNYSSEDIAKIMDVYETKYGESLMKAIQDDFSGSKETELRNILYNAAKEQAVKATGWESVEDIPQDICDEAASLYDSLNSSDYSDYSVGVDNLDKMDSTTRSKVLIAYEMLYGDDNAINTITQGKLYYGKEDGYVEHIIEGMLDLAATTPPEPVEEDEEE